MIYTKWWLNVMAGGILINIIIGIVLCMISIVYDERPYQTIRTNQSGVSSRVNLCVTSSDWSKSK